MNDNVKALLVGIAGTTIYNNITPEDMYISFDKDNDNKVSLNDLIISIYDNIDNNVDIENIKLLYYYLKDDNGNYIDKNKWVKELNNIDIENINDLLKSKATTVAADSKTNTITSSYPSYKGYKGISKTLENIKNIEKPKALADEKYNRDFEIIEDKDYINKKNFFEILCNPDNKNIINHMTISLIELLSYKKRRIGFLSICDIIINIIREHNKVKEIDCCTLDKEKELIYEIIKYNKDNKEINDKFSVLLEEIEVKTKEICALMKEVTISTLDELEIIIKKQQRKFLSNTLEYNSLESILELIKDENKFTANVMMNIQEYFRRYDVLINYDRNFSNKIKDYTKVSKYINKL